MNAEKRGPITNHSTRNGILRYWRIKAHEQLMRPATKEDSMAGSAVAGAISWQDRRSSQIRRSEPAQATPHKKGYRISDSDGDERDAKKQDKHQNDVECSGNDEIQHGIPLSSVYLP